jgi:hypothetical protein
MSIPIIFFMDVFFLLRILCCPSRQGLSPDPYSVDRDPDYSITGPLSLKNMNFGA